MMRSAVFVLLAASCFGAPLTDAVKAGDKGTVASLIQKKADVNAADADGTTPLQWAVRQSFTKDDLDIADQLIRAGADVKAANRYGVTALYLACLNGNAAMIERLLKAGADANATTSEGETALMTVARSGNVEAAKVLLAHGAALETRENWHQQTALMWATAENHPDMMRELIAHGADVNARDEVKKWERQKTSEPRDKWLPSGGLTPLLFAARQGCLECARILVSKDADINVVDPDGISAPLMATINGHYDVAAFLIEKGANPNLADSTGRAVLFSAVDFHTMPQSNRPSPRDSDSTVSSLELIQILLAHGANVNARLLTQQPYRTKLDRGDDTMLTTGTTPLLRAAKAGDAEVVRLLLSKGADAKLATKNDINPLMAAAGVGTKEEDTTGRHKTEAEAIETITLCLNAGLDINAADSRGETAMHGAAREGYTEVVKFLAQHGARVDAKNRRGQTPLDAAMGLAGGAGFDGTAGVPHPETAEAIRQLMTGPSAEISTHPR